MAIINHHISFQKGVSRFMNHQMELERLLAVFVSKTTYAAMKFRFEVENYNESPNEAQCAKVMIRKPDEYRTKMYLSVQLAGCAEILIVAMILTQEMSGKINNVQRQLRKAARDVFEEELHKTRISVSDVIEEKITEVEDPDVSLSQDDEKTDLGGGVEKTSRTKTSAVITERVIVQILDAWLSRTGGTKSISQRELTGIISDTVITKINKQLVIGFLRKKGFVEITSIVRKPQVTMTQKGIDLTKNFQRQNDLQKKEVENDVLLQMIQNFPVKVQPVLALVQRLQVMHHDLLTVRELRNTAIQNLAQLQVQILTVEKEISEHERNEKKCLVEIEQVISLLTKENVTGLISADE